MSEQWKLKQSRDNWKQKAIARGKIERARRKEIQRIRMERDRFKQEAKAAKSELDQQQRGQAALYGKNKTELVYLTLSLFVFARLGFRAISRVLRVVGPHFGLLKTPCTQTVSNWVTRLSIVKMQSASQSMIDAQMSGFTQGYIWLIDLSIGLGSGKILSIVAFLQYHENNDHAPRLQDAQCVAVAVADSWTGETIATFLTQVIANTGSPSAFLKDGGTDLNKAINLLEEQGKAYPRIADISHIIANLFKHEYGEHPLFSIFTAACGQVSKNLKQTLLASLAPPKVSTKARFMNLHHLVTWADKILRHSPRGGASEGSMLAKLRISLDQLPECKSFIKLFLRDATPLLMCQKILKNKGLNEKTAMECEKLIEVIPASSPIRKGFTDWVNEHLTVATELKINPAGLPISTDIIESLFGIGKRLGTGQIKDANRIASRLPVFCGTLTPNDAEKVVRISVVQQKTVMGDVSSLVRQRRSVLPYPGTLEDLAHSLNEKKFQMIPDPVAIGV